MYPLTHFLFTLVFAYTLFPFEFAVVIAVLSVLFDLDHFLYHLTKKKNPNFIVCWNNAVLGKEHERTFIHHLPGFLVVSGLVFFIAFLNSTAALAIAIAYYTHMFLDYVHFKPKETKKKSKWFGFLFAPTLYEIFLDLILVIILFFFSFSHLS